MFLLLLAGFMSSAVVLVSGYQYLVSRHSTAHFAIAVSLFEVYVLYHRLFGDKSKRIDGISLRLQLLDEYCRANFKKDLSNHSIDTAIKLLTHTRRVRQSFLKYSLAPTNEKITINKINGIECAWVNLKKAKEHGIIISFHGGAYVSGCARSCFPYLVPLCSMTGMAGCSVEYSLCPEALLPKSVEEGLEIYKYFIEKLEVNPKKIALIGDSAGGSLVLLMIQKMVREGIPVPCCGVTMSAWDVPSEGNSYSENEEKDSYLDQATARVWGELSVGNIQIDIEKMKCFWIGFKHSLNAPEYSYLSRDASFKGFCPLFLSASEWETMRDDSTRVVERCKQDGVEDVICEITPSTGVHVLEDWVGYGIPEALDLLHKEASFIVKHRAD